MNYVYHKNRAPYGDTTTIITEDASAYVMVTIFIGRENVAVIHDLVVLKERRGEGLGRSMLDEAVNQAKAMGAEVARLSVERGSWLEEWYKRHGFCETGEVEDLGLIFNVLEKSL